MRGKYTGILIVEGITLPDPSDMTPSDSDISDGERNAKGIMVAQLIRENVRKLEIKWKVLDPDDYAIIRTAIKKKFDLNVKYFDAVTCSAGEFAMYTGDRKVPIYTYEKGKPVYKDVALNLIEM